MRKQPTISEGELHAYIDELIRRTEDQFIFTNDDIIDDTQVMKIFKISQRTLLNYRKEGLIRCAKIMGRVYFLRPLLLQDILRMYK